MRDSLEIAAALHLGDGEIATGIAPSGEVLSEPSGRGESFDSRPVTISEGGLVGARSALFRVSDDNRIELGQHAREEA